MSSLDSLQHRLDRIVAHYEKQRQWQTAEQEEPVFFLPIKNDEPPIPYRAGPISFYVPEERLHEVAL